MESLCFAERKAGEEKGFSPGIVCITKETISSPHSYYRSGAYYICSSTVHFVAWWQEESTVSSLVMGIFESSAW